MGWAGGLRRSRSTREAVGKEMDGSFDPGQVLDRRLERLLVGGSR